MLLGLALTRPALPSLSLQYYRGAEAAIVVYDITSFVSGAAPFPCWRAPLQRNRALVCLAVSQESFEGAKRWVGELKTHGQPQVVIAFVANKCDLEDYRVVSSQEGKAYAQEQEMAYFETSAKTAHNVWQMFVDLAQLVPRKDVALSSTTSLEQSQQKGACC